MGKLLNADYRQQFMFTPSVENWVPADHPVRLIRELIEGAQKRGQLPKDAPNFEDGRPQYAPSLLLKIWVYGYMLRFRSTRKLEWACNNVLPVVWLAGTLRPDHNTLSRFWKEHRALIGRFFRMTVQVAFEMDLIGMVLQAVDGTKIQAAGSTRKAMTREQLEELRARVDRAITEIEQQIEKGDESEDQEDRLDERLGDRKKLAEAISKAMKQWPEDTRKRTMAELEAPMLKGTGIGYNGQAVADAKAGIIVTQDLVTDVNDERQLIPMLDKVERELGSVAKATVADGGYNTAEALGEAAKHKYEVVLNASSDERKGQKNDYHSSHFQYNAERDVVICPQERELEFERTTKRKRQAYSVRIFRGRVCGECPVRNACTKDERGRTIEISPHYGAVIANRERRQAPEGKAHLKTRMTLGERPFAVIKEVLGFRRFRLRGKAAAALEWTFITAIHNTMVLFRNMTEKEPVLATP